MAGLTDDELVDYEDAVTTFQVVEDAGLLNFNDPFFVNRTEKYETIK